MHRPIILILLLFLLSHMGAHGQNAEQKDTAKVYREIEAYSNKRKFSKFIYGLFFKPVVKQSTDKPKRKARGNQKSYKVFEGKVIRAIQITTLDPFGYSVTDTAIGKQNIFYTAGNRAHVKTQRITIRNLLLVHVNELFDSLLVRESERLIRTQRYVHEVSFYVVSAGSDSVDIIIRELDIWSIIPAVAITPSVFKVGLTDRNFIGLGHEFQTTEGWYSTTGTNAISAIYTIPNIRNTYVNARLQYSMEEYGNLIRSVDVERPFFSPVAKWAAGVLISHQFIKDSIIFQNDGYVPFNSKFDSYDFWAGNAIPVYKGKTEKARSTNLILSARYLQVNYLQKPEALYDSLHFLGSENFYLGGIGISTRKYVEDKFIFNYGLIEDVPVGQVYAVTGGYQIKNNTGRLYLGVRYSIGNYNRLGYLSTNFEYGTFFRSSTAEQGVFNAGLNYFTGLFEFGKWKVRQFVKPFVTYGIKRLPNERININNENGIRGFNPAVLAGSNKILLTLQTQTYPPWNILGFRFGPYLIYSMGMLSNTVSGFRNSRVYSQIGLGLLIKNEYLVFNYFQIFVAYYPYIPETGSNIFKINPNTSADFGFRDFEIGKPAITLYQ